MPPSAAILLTGHLRTRLKGLNTECRFFVGEVEFCPFLFEKKQKLIIQIRTKRIL